MQMVGGYQRTRREARPRSELRRPAALIGALITRGNSGPNGVLLPKAVKAWSPICFGPHFLRQPLNHYSWKYGITRYSRSIRIRRMAGQYLLPSSAGWFRKALIHERPGGQLFPKTSVKWSLYKPVLLRKRAGTSFRGNENGIAVREHR